MKQRTVLFSTLAVLAGVTMFAGWPRPSLASDDSYDGKRIPPDGLLLHPAAVNRGDPANAEKDLRRFYRALVAFRDKNNRLPKTPWELLDAGKAGIVDLGPDDFINPDAKYSENTALVAEIAAGKPIDLNRSYGFSWMSPLADGRDRNVPPDAPKVPWMGCSLYERANGRVFPGMKYRYEPDGFVMVLWSNGEITREGPDERLYVKTGPGEWTAFNPHTDTPRGRVIITERELYKKLEKGEQ